MTEADRFPGYDVLDKRATPSWDEVTRAVVAKRLAAPLQPRFLTAAQFAVADALCRRILPQSANRPPAPLAALLDAKLHEDHGDGFREADMPYMGEAWRQGLDALEAEAKGRHDGEGFAALDALQQDALISAMEAGELTGDGWKGLDSAKFFKRRVLVDVPGLYYCHPTAWSEIGFGGPASPRGYLRLEGDRRDPWEAAEATPGGEAQALRKNRHVV